MDSWNVVSLERFAVGDRWGIGLCFLLLCAYAWYLVDREDSPFGLSYGSQNSPIALGQSYKAVNH